MSTNEYSLIFLTFDLAVYICMDFCTSDINSMLFAGMQSARDNGAMRLLQQAAVNELVKLKILYLLLCI